MSKVFGGESFELSLMPLVKAVVRGTNGPSGFAASQPDPAVDQCIVSYAAAPRIHA